jgi:hypothetical protein
MEYRDETIDFKKKVRFGGEAVGFYPGEHIPRVLVRTLTLTEVNAANPGTVILPARTGYRYRILDIAVCSRTTMSAGTAVQFNSSNATPVLIASFARANLADGVILRFGITGATPSVSAAFGLPMLVDEGLNLHMNNHDAADTVGLDIIVTYAVEDLLK